MRNCCVFVNFVHEMLHCLVWLVGNVPRKNHPQHNDCMTGKILKLNWTQPKNKRKENQRTVSFTSAYLMSGTVEYYSACKIDDLLHYAMKLLDEPTNHRGEFQSDNERDNWSIWLENIPVCSPMMETIFGQLHTQRTLSLTTNSRNSSFFFLGEMARILCLDRCFIIRYGSPYNLFNLIHSNSVWIFPKTKNSVNVYLVVHSFLCAVSCDANANCYWKSNSRSSNPIEHIRLQHPKYSIYLLDNEFSFSCCIYCLFCSCHDYFYFYFYSLRFLTATGHNISPLQKTRRYCDRPPF